MDTFEILNKIFNAATEIDTGRKGFATDGGEHEGRISYEKGLSLAKAAFDEVVAYGDVEMLILAEQAFLRQELQFCAPADTATNNSITQAVSSFDDALRSLKIVKIRASYRIAENTYSHHKKYRIQGMPKDAFHSACISHIAQNLYLKLQKDAIG